MKGWQRRPPVLEGVAAQTPRSGLSSLQPGLGAGDAHLGPGSAPPSPPTRGLCSAALPGPHPTCPPPSSCQLAWKGMCRCLITALAKARGGTLENRPTSAM